MAEAQADLPGARPEHCCVIGREVILSLLDGDQPLATDEDVVYVCNDVDVAMDSAGQRFIACAHPAHGHAPPYADLARRIAEIQRSLGNAAPQCPICGGSGWLPLGSGAAHRQYALMRATGYFRALQIPQLERTGDGHGAIQNPMSSLR